MGKNVGVYLGGVASGSGCVVAFTYREFALNAVMSISTETEPTLRNGVPEWVDVRLRQWAIQTRHNPPGAWPSITIEGKLIDYGPDAMAASKGMREPMISDEVAEVDHVIAKAPARTRTILEKEYKTWQTQDEKAKQCHVSLSLYKIELRSALWYVYGRLE